MQSGISRPNVYLLYKSLERGELVEFDVVQGEKGPVAVNVTGPKGAAVLGHPLTPPADRRMYLTEYLPAMNELFNFWLHTERGGRIRARGFRGRGRGPRGFEYLGFCPQGLHSALHILPIITV